MPISAQHSFPAGQRADQHEQRGLRQVEVGQQGVDDEEAIARIDEDIGFAAAGFDACGCVIAGFFMPAGGPDVIPARMPSGCGSSRKLKSADGGRANGDDPRPP